MGHDGDNKNLKWDQRFRHEECVLGSDPSAFLADNIEQIKRLAPGKRALDIACGEGRNSIYLAKQGFEVVGLDISQAGLEKARAWMEKESVKIDLRLVDLEGYHITERYDLIINFNFLLRELIPEAVAALAPGGVMMFDTLVDSPFVCCPHKKEYLLKPGEIVLIFRKFKGEILQSEERLHDEMPTAKLIFRKG